MNNEFPFILYKNNKWECFVTEQVGFGKPSFVKEINKLSDEYVLINDFNLSFSPAIFYKKQNQLEIH